MATPLPLWPGAGPPCQLSGQGLAVVCTQALQTKGQVGPPARSLRITKVHHWPQGEQTEQKTSTTAF